MTNKDWLKYWLTKTGSNKGDFWLTKTGSNKGDFWLTKTGWNKGDFWLTKTGWNKRDFWLTKTGSNKGAVWHPSWLCCLSSTEPGSASTTDAAGPRPAEEPPGALQPALCLPHAHLAVGRRRRHTPPTSGLRQGVLTTAHHAADVRHQWKGPWCWVDWNFKWGERFGIWKSVVIVGVGTGGFVTNGDHCLCVIRFSSEQIIFCSFLLSNQVSPKEHLGLL